MLSKILVRLNFIFQYVRNKLIFRLMFCIEDFENTHFRNDWHIYCVLKKKYKNYIKSIKKYKTSNEKFNKIVWWVWFQGLDSAPDIVKACFESVKKTFPDYEINVITEKNMFDFIDLPDYIKVKYQKGIITKTHFSDILRTLLLIKYGGVWIDSTVYFTGVDPVFYKKSLFFYKNILRGDRGCCLSSWFIISEPNNPILCMTRDLLFEYWRKRNKLKYYFLFHYFFTISCEEYIEIFNNVSTYSNLTPHILQLELLNPYNDERFEEIKNISSIHKLTYKISDLNNIETNLKYIIDTTLYQ